MKNLNRTSSKINKIAPKILLGISFFYMTSGAASAISLDDFRDYQDYPLNAARRGAEVRNENNNKLYNSVVQKNASAVGSTRSLELTAPYTAGTFGEVHLGYSSGFGNTNSLTHNSSFKGRAQTFISYDGDDKVGLTDFTGLNLDLKEGNADKLQFDVWYDLPFNQPMELEFTFYDKSDATGNTFSRGVYSVDQRYVDNDKFGELGLSFSALSIFGPNGGANLSNIGAFSVLFNGTDAPAADFAFSNFRTNGSGSTPVPEPATVGLLLSGLFGLSRRKKSLA